MFNPRSVKIINKKLYIYDGCDYLNLNCDIDIAINKLQKIREKKHDKYILLGVDHDNVDVSNVANYYRPLTESEYEQYKEYKIDCLKKIQNLNSLINEKD